MLKNEIAIENDKGELKDKEIIEMKEGEISVLKKELNVLKPADRIKN